MRSALLAILAVLLAAAASGCPPPPPGPSAARPPRSPTPPEGLRPRPDQTASRPNQTASGPHASEARAAPEPAPADVTASPGPEEQAPATAIHSDALVVNDDTLSVNDILEPLLPSLEQLARELPPRAYYERVGELVRRQIIEAVAQHLIWRRARLKITEEMNPQIDQTVDRVEKDRINREFGGSETRYQKYLAQRRKTRAEVRERLRRAVVVEAYLREHLLPLIPAPRKPELRQFYDTHRDRFTRPARRELWLIDVPVAEFLEPRRPSTATERERARTQARAAVEEAAAALRAGQPFEEVARRYSRGPNRENGGSWGMIAEPLQGRWREPSRRLEQMQPGEVSEILEAEDGFFIVKLGRQEGGEEVSFVEAQPQIVEYLRQERFSRLRAEFLQGELERSTLGSLDAFVTEVLKAVPPPAGR